MNAAFQPRVATRYPVTTGASTPARLAIEFCTPTKLPAKRGTKLSPPLAYTGVAPVISAAERHKRSTITGSLEAWDIRGKLADAPTKGRKNNLETRVRLRRRAS